MALTKLKIIYLKNKLKLQHKYTFRGYCYTEIDIQVTEDMSELCYTACGNFSCSMSLIDRLLLTRLYLKIELQQMNASINVWEIGINYHITSQFIHINIFIKVTDKVDDTVIVHMCKEFHVINDLKVNILIDTDILRTEDINLKFFINEMIFINHKDITASMWVWYKNNILHTPLSIWISQVIRLSSFSTVNVPIKRNSILKGHDFIFTLIYKKSLGTGRGVRVHFLNCNTGFVQVHNILSHIINIGHQLKLSYISEMSEAHFYKVSKKYKYLVNIKPETHVNKHRNWIQQNTVTVTAMLVASMRLQIFSEASDFCFIALTELSALFDDIAVTGSLLTEPDINHIIKINPCFKHRSKLGFTAYEILKIMQQLTDIVKSFSTIWEDHGLLVDLFKQDWMAINLKEDTESQSERMYLVSHQNWKVIDEIFNKMHKQKKMF